MRYVRTTNEVKWPPRTISLVCPPPHTRPKPFSLSTLQCNISTQVLTMWISRERAAAAIYCTIYIETGYFMAAHKNVYISAAVFPVISRGGPDTVMLGTKLFCPFLFVSALTVSPSDHSWTILHRLKQLHTGPCAGGTGGEVYF